MKENQIMNKILDEMCWISKTIETCKTLPHYLSTYNLLLNFKNKYSHLKNDLDYDETNKLINNFFIHKRISLINLINSSNFEEY